MFAGMSKPRPKSRSLSCTAVDFVEVEFPQSITPRLVLQFTEGISILLEKPDDIAFASELVAAIRSHLGKKGGRPC
jgi:hypothetical protein